MEEIARDSVPVILEWGVAIVVLLAANVAQGLLLWWGGRKLVAIAEQAIAADLQQAETNRAINDALKLQIEKQNELEKFIRYERV